MHPDTIDPKAYARRWKTLAVLSLSLLIIGLDNTVLNVALPTLQTHFSASGSTLQWIVDSYLLSFAGVLLTMGTLGDRFGRKRALQSGLAAVRRRERARRVRPERRPADRAARRDGHRRRDDHAGHAVGDHGRLPARGARQGDRHLVGDRGRRHRPRPVRRRAAARVVLVELGVLAQRADRRRRAGRRASCSSPRAATRDPGAFDLRGAALSIATLVTLVYGIIEASPRGWTDPLVLGCFAAAAVLGVAFVAWERRVASPMLPLGVLPRPALHRRVRRRRARLLRDDGLGLRLHAVPPVRARLQRAGGGRRDAAARARPRHRLRRVQPPVAARRPDPRHRGRPVRRRGRAEHQPRLDAGHGARAARARHVRPRAVDGLRDGAGHRRPS